MRELVYFGVALVATGFLLAIGLVQYLLRHRLKIDMAEPRLTFRMPILGEFELDRGRHGEGFQVAEACHVFKQAERIGRLVDLDVVMDYAQRYEITYVGFEGDMPDRNWTPGRLAYSTIHRGYAICLNPDLDLLLVARKLSEQLRRPLLPDDVYPFLFFHEIGHSTRAGNQCYITAQVQSSLSGGRRTAKRRRELRRLHVRIERYADEFAWKELARYRATHPSHVKAG